MRLQHKILLTAAVVVIGVAAILAIASQLRTHRMEREVEAARVASDALRHQASESEKLAAGYKAKTEYLESQIASIRDLANKQDEQLQTIDNDIRTSRGDVERARRIRASRVTADQLCAKLAELGQ